MAGTAAIGTQIKYVDSGSIIGRLTKIGGVSMTSDEQDVTTHDSVGGFKETIPTLKDGGTVDIEGNMGPNDAGQVELLAHFEAGDTRSMIITYPDGPGGAAGSTWEFDAVCTAYTYGEADVNGVLSFSASLKISGYPEFTAVGGS
jgi:predicted secreted protein